MMLKLALPRIKKLGIDNILITCDDTNIASRKIIGHNGGVLETSRDQGSGKPKKNIYWINTRP